HATKGEPGDNGALHHGVSHNGVSSGGISCHGRSCSQTCRHVARSFCSRVTTERPPCPPARVLRARTGGLPRRPRTNPFRHLPCHLGSIKAIQRGIPYLE